MKNTAGCRNLGSALLITMLLSGCGRGGAGGLAAETMTRPAPPRPVRLRTMKEGEPQSVEGAVVARDDRLGRVLAEIVIQDGRGVAEGLPPEFIAEIFLDGYCDAVSRLTINDGVAVIDLGSLQQGTTIRASPVVTPGIPPFTKIFLQTLQRHGCTISERLVPSRGPTDHPTWCVPVHCGD